MKLLASKEAKLRYTATSFTTLEKGDFVLCKTTGEKIPLDELKYWNVERQEAYVDAAASLRRQRSLEEGEKS